MLRQIKRLQPDQTKGNTFQILHGSSMHRYHRRMPHRPSVRLQELPIYTPGYFCHKYAFSSPTDSSPYRYPIAFSDTVPPVPASRDIFLFLPIHFFLFAFLPAIFPSLPAFSQPQDCVPEYPDILLLCTQEICPHLLHV